IVGATRYDHGQPDEGVALVFHGGPSGIASGNPSTAAALLESNQNTSFFGSVAGGGGGDGGGYSDVIAGASYYSDGQGEEGAAFVFVGSASGIASGGPATAAARLQSNQALSHQG